MGADILRNLTEVHLVPTLVLVTGEGQKAAASFEKVIHCQCPLGTEQCVLVGITNLRNVPG